MAATPSNPLDPRSLARASVRAKIAQSVFNAFAERGFEETTASEAAEAAGISRASFFRYFNSKEEAVFVAQEAIGADIAAALAERPAEEGAWTALRRSFDVAVEDSERSPEEALARARLVREVPALRAHHLERLGQWRRMIVEVLAPRLGREPRDLHVEALAGAALATFDAAASRWAERGEADGLVELIDAAFEAAAGFIAE